MTVIRPNSISGINSITANGGDINLFRADGTKADIPIVNNITAGVVTATKFVGSIEATTGTFSGNLGVAGVLTYEDVTNIDSIGIITARSTVSIADSIIHTGDTNTSLRFPAADTITAETGGSERLRIDSSGRMFLGLTATSFPKRLNVQGSSGAIIALKNNDTTSYAADTNTSIEFGLNTGNTGNQNGACEIRAFKENGTNGNNARGLSFYTGTNGGSPTKRLVIHPEGWVEKTNQLSLARYGNSNLSISNNSETVLSHFGGLAYETGGGNSYWDTSNHKFTAPVAGMYMVYCKINLNTNTGWGHDAFLAVRKNGSKSWFTGAGSDPWYDLLGANSEYYRGLFVFVNVPCAKNDEIDFLVRQNSGGTRTLYGSMSYFNIYHLG